MSLISRLAEHLAMTMQPPRAIVYPTGYRVYLLVTHPAASRALLCDETPRERWKRADRNRRFAASLESGRIRVEGTP